MKKQLIMLALATTMFACTEENITPKLNADGGDPPPPKTWCELHPGQCPPGGLPGGGGSLPLPTRKTPGKSKPESPALTNKLIVKN